MSPNLSPPPKFSTLGPSSPSEWLSFYRWLVSLWRTASSAVTGQQMIALRSPQAKGSDDDAIGAAQVFATGQPQPGRSVLEDAASIAAYSPRPSVIPVEELTSGRMMQLRQQPGRPGDDLTSMVQYALAKPPHPQRPGAMVIIDSHANRVNYPAASYPPGTLYWEWDRTVFYLDRGTVWTYCTGVCLSPQASIPSDLGSYDGGFTLWVVDYNHRLEWTGANWAWAAGEEGSGEIRAFLQDPIPTGWHLCDGTAGVSYLKPDGTLGTVNLPNLTTGTYLQFGAAASGVNLPTAPILTMDPYTPAGVVSANTFTGTTGTTSGPNATTNVVQGTGGTVTVAASGHTHTFTPAGSDSAPTFVGTAATLTGTISKTGQPQNIVLRPWFRQ